MTDDEIQKRVDQAPRLARQLLVPTRFLVGPERMTEPVGEWCGIKVFECKFMPKDTIMWLDKDHKVLAVQKITE